VTASNALCHLRPKAVPTKPVKTKPPVKPVKRSEWNKGFDLKKAAKIWQAAQGSGARPPESR